jgi:two-component system, chemotaxis family, protein-glutamate methylesterase/glutaminase
LTIKQIAELLTDLANRTSAGAPDHVSPTIQTEVEFIKMTTGAEDMSDLGGNPTAFACPSCHGALWELQNGNLTRYRCHTGHAFSPESLLAEQSDAIEQALYSALRALQEKGVALRRLAAHYANLPDLRRDYEARASAAETSADAIRRLLKVEKKPQRATDPFQDIESVR